MNAAQLDRHRTELPALDARYVAGDAIRAAYEAVAQWIDDAHSAALEAREQAFALMESAGVEPEVSKIDRAIESLAELKNGNWRE